MTKKRRRACSPESIRYWYFALLFPICVCRIYIWKIIWAVASSSYRPILSNFLLRLKSVLARKILHNTINGFFVVWSHFLFSINIYFSRILYLLFFLSFRWPFFSQMVSQGWFCLFAFSFATSRQTAELCVSQKFR